MAFSLSHISETYSHAITKSMELHTTIKGHYRFISKGKAICDYLFIVIHNMHGIERKQLVEFFSSCEAIHFQCLFLVNLHYYCSLKTRNLDCLTLQHEVERITAFQTLWTTRSILHFISSHVFIYYKTIVWNDEKAPPHPSKPAIPPSSSPTSTFISVPTIAT
jgi:hypothetical protein